MIVRNEAHGICATLDSIKQFVDHWTILDTGSIDGTQDAVRRCLSGVDGTLHEGEFIDFSSARNLALELHGSSTEWVLMLDADDIVDGGKNLRDAVIKTHPSDQALLVKRQLATSWHVPILLRTSSRWRYRGRVHEYVCGPTGEHASKRVENAVINHIRPQQSAEASRSRWQRDALLLEEDLKSGKDAARTLYYLAQTYDCLGNKGKAAEFYERRASLPGWGEETFQAKMRLGLCLLSLNKPKEALSALLDAHSFNPKRAEPLFHLADFYRIKGDFTLSYLFSKRCAAIPTPKDGMFVDEEIYAWKSKDVLAISAYYLSKSVSDLRMFEEGKAAADAALAARPNDSRLLRNRAFFG
jgi:glycosyltransferase involved in cell wall biosynthesis